jgi:hypothetical protein
LTVFGSEKTHSYLNSSLATAILPRKSKRNQNAMKEKLLTISSLQTAREEVCCCRIFQFHGDALFVVGKCIVPI